MINFKNPEERAPSALIVLSLLILAGTLAYMLFVPAPSAAGIARGRVTSRRKIQDEIRSTRERNDAMEREVAPLLWQGSVESITSRVLARVTNLANRQNLKVAAFRPQKTQPLDATTELPFNVQVSGTYAQLRALVDQLDRPQSKVALRSVQVASSDTATDAVTAAITLSAYTLTAEPTAPAQGGASQ
jgi:Tfp pilus assembly protein PilO